MYFGQRCFSSYSDKHGMQSLTYCTMRCFRRVKGTLCNKFIHLQVCVCHRPLIALFARESTLVLVPKDIIL
jgi:hypothetical protein